MSGISAGTIARTAPLIETLRDIAKAHGATVAQVALAWVISFHGRAVVAIPGATKPAQASDSAAAMGIGLSEAELLRIDEVSRRAVRARTA